MAFGASVEEQPYLRDIRDRHPCLSFAKQNLTAAQHQQPG